MSRRVKGGIFSYALRQQLLWSVVLGLVCLSTKLSALSDMGMLEFRRQAGDGLKGVYINASIRDSEGFLWVATDSGVKRFDTKRVTSFRHEPANDRSLSSNNMLRFHLQRDGTLWVFGEGLNRFDPNTQTFTRYDIGRFRLVWDVVETSDEMFWLAGAGVGLVQFDPRQGKVVQRITQGDGAEDGVNDGLADNNTYALSLESDRYLWVAGQKGLQRFDTITGRFKNFSAGGSRHMPAIKSRAVALINGEVWVGSTDGLYVIDPSVGVVREYHHEFDDPHSLSSSDVWSIFQNVQGHLWVGTHKGLNFYHPRANRFIRYPTVPDRQRNLPPAEITNIFEDPEGSLWVSAARHGLYLANPVLQKFSVYRHLPFYPLSLGYDNLLDLHEDHQGQIWVATDGGGLDRLDPISGEFSHFRADPTNPNSLSSDSVISLSQDNDGFIWAGTYAGGMNRLNPATGRVQRFLPEPDNPNSLAGEHVFRIKKDNQGMLWLSIWQVGLQRFDPRSGEFTTFLGGKTPNMSGYTYDSIAFDQRGDIWVGSHAGLDHIDGKTLAFRPISELREMAIIDIYVADDGVLWLATDSGVYRYDPDTQDSTKYTTEDGLSDNYVTGIERDKDGYFWFGTRRGLNRFDPDTRYFEVFTEHDGLQSDEQNRYSHLYAASGRMYFGGPKGLTVFDPADIPRNERAPRIVITGFELFQQPVELGQSPYLTKHISRTDHITLPVSQRDIAFEFNALSFIAAEKNRFRFRLSGLEDAWTEVGGDRRWARYTNLGPGRYRFQVVGANSDEIWTTEVTEITLTILPAWWATWWARATFLLMIVLSVYGIVFWRVKYNTARADELERLVEEKTLSLKLAHEKMSSLNIHLEERVAERTRKLEKEIDERVDVENKLFHMAFHDNLTGLPNRAWLLKELHSCVDAAANDNAFKFGLLFLDGDRFKQINDSFGHLTGDDLLIAVAKRLSSVLNENFKLIRLGGDEFTILATNIAALDALVDVSKRILTVLNEPFHIHHHQIFFRASIGIVMADHRYDSPSDVLRDADIAMYRAKEEGRRTYRVFDAKMSEEVLEMIKLEEDLGQAIEQDQLSLRYQPIIDLNTGELIAFEALLRWQHPDKGYIPPSRFIRLAEESGLIFSLGLWVLKRVCEQINTWKKLAPENLVPVTVNLSPVQLYRSGLLEAVDDILTKTQVESRFIKIEITESALMENMHLVLEVLNALRDRDFELSIDDFGTGYSSLSYLDQLPIQILKIDRQFVDGLGRESGGAKEIVSATIALAHNLGLKVVAEGVETAAQYRILQSLDCDFLQGYYIERPLTVEKATDFINRFCEINMLEG